MKKVKSIMIIDDNEDDVLRNRKILENLNIVDRFQAFSSAQDALNYFKLVDDVNAYYHLLAPQLILLNINMPFNGGFVFLEEFDKFRIFKEKPIDIFILYSSICPGDRDRVNNFNIVSGFISKPLEAIQLISQLEDIC